MGGGIGTIEWAKVEHASVTAKAVRAQGVSWSLGVTPIKLEKPMLVIYPARALLGKCSPFGSLAHHSTSGLVLGLGS